MTVDRADGPSGTRSETATATTAMTSISRVDDPDRRCQRHRARVGHRHDRPADAGAECGAQREHELKRRRAESLLAGHRGLEHHERQHRVGEAHPEAGDRPAQRRRRGSGSAGRSTSAVMTMPAPMRAAPLVTSVRRMPAAAARAWTHEPAVQVTAAADSARPPSVTLPPRTSTTLSGTNASVPKNANVMPNTTATTDGRPRRRRSVPGRQQVPQRADRQPAPRDAQQQRQRQAADRQRRQQQRRADRQAHAHRGRGSRRCASGRQLRCAGPRRASCG